MSDDRYAPPTAALGEPARARGTGQIDLGEAFREAWGATWANFPMLLGVGLLFLVIASLSVLTVVGIFLVLPVLAWGATRFALNVIDGGGEVADIFSGFSDYGRVLGSMLIAMIVIMLIYVAGQSVSILGQMAGSGVLAFLGAIVNLAFSFVVLPRLTFIWYYIVDQDLSPMDALQTSWNATSDQKLTCLLLAILSSVITVIGVLCLVIGVIPALMMAYLMQAAAYRQLAGR